MELGLKGKKVLVQGASSGMGFAIAKAFVDEGCYVGICSSHPERIGKAAADIKAEAHFAIDLDKPGAGAELIHQGVRKLGGIDILVTNTGSPKHGLAAELTPQDWLQGHNRLWMSAVEAITAAIPIMKKQQFGRILLLTSIAAKEPIPHLTLSNSYRAGLLGFMKSISHELAKDSITANAILPGLIKTKRLDDLGSKEEQLLSQIPMHRFGKPDEIASLFVFLASRRADYITGQAISCDGGYLHSY
jgi:3-oxoacyl-[acyl-carrier protein] reductase